MFRPSIFSLEKTDPLKSDGTVRSVFSQAGSKSPAPLSSTDLSLGRNFEEYPAAQLCEIRLQRLCISLPKKEEHIKNRGTPKSSILIGFSIINHPFWGTPIFGNTHIFFLLLSCKMTYPWGWLRANFCRSKNAPFCIIR